MVPIEYTTSRHPQVVFRPHRAHCMLACLTHPMVPLLCRQWPLPPPPGPFITVGLSSATYPRFSSLQQRYPPPCAGAQDCPAPSLPSPCSGALPALRLRSFPRNAGAIPLPSPALSLALGRRSPPCLISAPLPVTPALLLAQCQGWRRLCTKNSASTARQIAPAKSGRKSWGRESNSAGDARKAAPAKCERQHRGCAKGGTGIAK